MPVPKEHQRRYSIIVATLQKRHGLSLEAAKRKADEAIKKEKVEDASGSKRHKR